MLSSVDTSSHSLNNFVGFFLFVFFMFPGKILRIEPLKKQSNQCHLDTEALSASVSKN